MEPFLGEIRLVGFNFNPRGWMLCAGQTLSIAQYSALFALLGTQYGGNGQTTFQLPDLRGRVPVGHGTGPGLTGYDIGQVAGSERVTLTQSQMPAHTHGLSSAKAELPVTNDRATTTRPAGAVPAAGGSYGAAGTATNDVPVSGNVAPSGGSQPFDVRQPQIAMNYVIAVEGIWPSRD